LVDATAVDSRYGSLEEERIRENQKTGAGPGNWNETVWSTQSKGRSQHEVQENQSMKRLNWQNLRIRPEPGNLIHNQD
jgi:hypothetical protein